MDCITVIVAVYNVEKYVEECLYSIMNQTYANLEIIVVDDGSIDESGKICDRLAAMDSRIRVIHKGNGGVSSARNAGLALATGDYVAFVDGDDYLDKDMYDCMISQLKKFNAQMAVCSFRYIYHNKTKDVSETFSREIITRENYLGTLLKDAFGFYYSVVWNKLIDRDVIRDNHFVFDEKWSVMEDFRFVLQLLTRVEKIAVCSQSLYNYRKNNYGTATYREIPFEESFCNRRQGYLWLKECLVACDYYDQNKNMATDYLIRYLANQFAKAVFSRDRKEKLRKHAEIRKREFIVKELSELPLLFRVKRKIYWNVKCLIEGAVQQLRRIIRQR